MTEVRRLITTPVDWGVFDNGNVLTIFTGRKHRCSVPGSRVLLLSASGIIVTDTNLSDEMGDVMSAAVNPSNVAVCCSSRGSGRNQRTSLSFVSGSQVLRTQDVSLVNNNEGARHHSVVCLRMSLGDVAVYALGTNLLFGCVFDGRQCRTFTLRDFGSASVRRLLHGRHPQEVIVLLDDGSVALATLSEHDDGVVKCSVQHHLQISSTSVPTHAVFACGSVLWALCDDHSLQGYWFPPPVDGEEAGPSPILSEQLSLPKDKKNLKVFLEGETRTCGVHVFFQTPTEVHFWTLAMHNPDGPFQPPTPVKGWSRSLLHWTGYVHSFSFRQCVYELLVQSEVGESPLCVMSLRKNSSVLTVEESEHRILSHQIILAAPQKLVELRERCELSVQELEATAAKVRSLYTANEAISQVINLQHGLVATWHRERELNKELQPFQSISTHLIRRLHTVYIRLSVYRLLYTAEFDEKLDIPLRKVFELEEARRAASLCQADLRSSVEREMDLSPMSAMESLSLWGSSDRAQLMCIDAILSELGSTDMCTLREIIERMTVMVPAIALLVLYAVHASQQQQQGAEEEGGGVKDAEIAMQVQYESPQMDSVRGEFLDSFALPHTVDMWAFLAFVADHRLNPTTVGAVHGAGCPPLLNLIPGLINGLTYAGAYELVFQLTGLVLTLSSVNDLDSSVAVKLLFLAYMRGNAKILEILYRRSHGTLWRKVATHAIAWAASQTENVKLLSGLIPLQSPEEAIAESVLRRGSNPRVLELLLMEFYTLMHRYAEALKMCEKIASCDSIDAQRVQVIALHLRSLMPNGNTSFGLHQSPEGADRARAADADSRPRRLMIRPPSYAALAGGPLRGDEAQLERDVARTTACIAEQTGGRPEARGSSQPREVSAAAFTPTPAASLGIVHGAATTTTAQQLEQNSRQSMSTRCGAESDSVGDVSSSTMLPPRMHAAVLQSRDVLFCEAILKRSKKPCGRQRPCEYHDRVRK